MKVEKGEITSDELKLDPASLLSSSVAVLISVLMFCQFALLLHHRRSYYMLSGQYMFLDWHFNFC
jgi:hypothetical protein